MQCQPFVTNRGEIYFKCVKITNRGEIYLNRTKIKQMNYKIEDSSERIVTISYNYDKFNRLNF